MFWSFLRRVIFPIERSEVRLFTKLATILFCILFNFSCLRILKDGLVIPMIGAESISFLKFWLVLPSAVIFTIIYVKLSNVFELHKLFAILVGSFIVVLLLFAFVIYPSQDFYHTAHGEIEQLILQIPYLKWFIKIFAKWSYALVYVVAELWSAIVINLMFWQFANHLFECSQAQRIYPMLGMFGNCGLIIAGGSLIQFARVDFLPESISRIISSSGDSVEITIKIIVAAITIASLVAVFLFCNIYNTTPKSQNHLIHLEETKTSLSVFDSLKLIFSSSYLLYVLILVVSYGLAINILEGPWKNKMSQLYTNPCDYINFMANFNVWMGVSSVIMTIIGGNILRFFGWRVSAYITPIMIGVSGTLFFIFVIFGQQISPVANPIYIAVMIGALQNILSKASKYSLFDSTKEMAYIPLSLELKAKGKAAVEVLGSKFGKSLGAFLQFTAFTIFPELDFDRMSIFLVIIFILIISVWLVNVGKLSKEYYKFNNEKNS